jgi:hypothetical protein
VILILQDAVHTTKRLSVDHDAVFFIKVGFTITFEIPVSSSRLKKTNATASTLKRTCAKCSHASPIIPIIPLTTSRNCCHGTSHRNSPQTQAALHSQLHHVNEGSDSFLRTSPHIQCSSTPDRRRPTNNRHASLLLLLQGRVRRNERYAPLLKLCCVFRLLPTDGADCLLRGTSEMLRGMK